MLFLLRLPLLQVLTSVSQGDSIQQVFPECLICTGHSDPHSLPEGVTSGDVKPDDQSAQDLPGFKTVSRMSWNPLAPRQTKMFGPLTCGTSNGPDTVTYRLSIIS